VRRRVAGTLAAAIAFASAHAVGANSQDVATAQALFDEAKRLMKAGRYSEACPKLIESARLDAAAGTTLALALCHESEGKTASAWAEWGEVLSDARRDHRQEREQAAQQHLKALEPRLVRATIVVAQEVPGFEVKRDGQAIGKPQWGVAIPIDPGQHVFEAHAPGKIDWKQAIDLQGEGKTIEVKVPPLQDAPVTPPVPSATATTSATVAPPPPTSSAPPPPPPSLPPVETSPRGTIGLVVGGAGLLAIGIGSYFGIHASSLWSDAHAACPNDKCTSQANVTKGNDAGNAANVATVCFIGGAFALAIGGVLFATAPAPERPKSGDVHVAPTLGGVTVWGHL
jgi:hypothetical protein